VAHDSQARSKLHPAWAGVVFAAVAWHGVNICSRLGCDYLLSVCFVANLILAAGILARSGLLIGIGYGWALIALPLWAIESFRVGFVAPSSVALHATGIGLGFCASRRTLIPNGLVFAAVPVGLLALLLARLLTRPEFNINTAFRVQEGWTGLFPDHRVYLLVQLAVYAAIFYCIPRVSNRFVCGGG